MLHKLLQETIPAYTWAWQSYPRNAGKYSILMQFYHLWREKLTSIGKLLILITLAAILIEFLPGVTFLLLWITFALCALSIAFVRSLFRPQIILQCSLPHTSQVNQIFSIPCTLLTKRGKQNCINLQWFRLPDHCQEHSPKQANLTLSPQKTIELSLLFKRRGIYTLPSPTILKVEPLGLLQGRYRSPLNYEIAVHPKDFPFDQYPRLSSQIKSRFPTQQNGNIDNASFSHTREYQEGDHFRKIHHRAWAKKGFPIVKENQQETYIPHVSIYLDLNPVTFSNRRLFEPMLSFTYSLLKQFHTTGYKTSLYLPNSSVQINHAEQLLSLCTLKWNKKNHTFLDLPKSAILIGVGNSNISSVESHFRITQQNQSTTSYTAISNPSHWKEWLDA